MTTHGSRFFAGCLALLLALAAAARAEAPSTERYERDVAFLSSKIAQHRYTLRATPEGEQRLATLETAEAKLKSLLSDLREQAEEIGTKDSQLHELKDMELGPKERTVERLRQEYQQWDQSSQQDVEALKRDSAVYASGQLTFSKEENAAFRAKYADWQALEARRTALHARIEQGRKEFQERFDAAVRDLTKAQQEYSETETKREQAAARFQETANQYVEARAPMAEALEAADNQPAPATVAVPLTPFSQGVAPQDAGTVPVVKPPIGPGSNTRALDQVRVVVASSVSGAETVDASAPVGKTQSGYEFDTGGGLGKADLPAVATPEASPADAVPLVVPPAPAAREDAPAAVKQSPVLQALAQQRTDAFTKLDALYQRRREIFQQGADAKPEAWTEVVKGIAQAQADANMAGVGLKLAEGSQLMDLTITPKAQHTPSDLKVPPPPSPVPAAKQP